ncbi:MAG TPA: hypothetical protein VLU25_03765 [Acidobacteriota bacterium]|nr:hypothetical protein [Acidobacteriota bacterium]
MDIAQAGSLLSSLGDDLRILEAPLRGACIKLTLHGIPVIIEIGYARIPERYVLEVHILARMTEIAGDRIAAEVAQQLGGSADCWEHIRYAADVVPLACCSE